VSPLVAILRKGIINVVSLVFDVTVERSRSRSVIELSFNKLEMDYYYFDMHRVLVQIVYTGGIKSRAKTFYWVIFKN